MKVKIVFYSMYRHIHRMAEAVAKGTREVDGAEEELLQAPEDILEQTGAKNTREAFAHIPSHPTGLFLCLLAPSVR